MSEAPGMHDPTLLPADIPAPQDAAPRGILPARDCRT